MYRFVELNEIEFANFATNHTQGNWLQTLSTRNLRELQGYQVYLLGVKENSRFTESQTVTVEKNERVKAVALLQVRKGRGLILKGPLLDYNDVDLINFFLVQIIEFCSKIKCAFLSIYPNWIYRTLSPDGELLYQNLDWGYLEHVLRPFQPIPSAQGIDPILSRFDFVKDLSGIKHTEQLLASFRPNTRRNVRKTFSPSYRVRDLDFNELGILQDLFDQSNVRNQISGRGLSYLEFLYQSCAEIAKFKLVEYNDKPISGAVFFESNREITYFMGGSATQFLEMRGVYFLMYDFMKHCLLREIPRFNMLGVAGRFEQNSLLRFKRGFGGFIEEGIGGWSHVINSKHYFWLRVKTKLASWL